MVDRLVATGLLDGSNERVRRIVTESNLVGALTAAEVAADGFTDEPRERHPSPACLVLELPVRLGRESEVRGDVLRHGGTTISRYRIVRNGVRRYRSARSISGNAKYTTNAADAA